MHCSPERHTGTTILQTWLFSPEVTNPFHSERLCLVQVTRKRREEGEGESPHQHTPARFPPPGKSAGWGSHCVLPTSRHATFLLTPAAEKQASLQQDTRPGTEYSYSSALFLSQLHRMNYMYTHPNSHVLLNYHMHCGDQMNSRVQHVYPNMNSCVHHASHAHHARNQHLVYGRGQHGKMTTKNSQQNFPTCYVLPRLKRSPRSLLRQAE